VLRQLVTSGTSRGQHMSFSISRARSQRCVSLFVPILQRNRTKLFAPSYRYFGFHFPGSMFLLRKIKCIRQSFEKLNVILHEKKKLKDVQKTYGISKLNTKIICLFKLCFTALIDHPPWTLIFRGFDIEQRRMP